MLCTEAVKTFPGFLDISRIWLSRRKTILVYLDQFLILFWRPQLAVSLLEITLLVLIQVD